MTPWTGSSLLSRRAQSRRCVVHEQGHFRFGNVTGGFDGIVSPGHKTSGTSGGKACMLSPLLVGRCEVIWKRRVQTRSEGGGESRRVRGWSLACGQPRPTGWPQSDSTTRIPCFCPPEGSSLPRRPHFALARFSYAPAVPTRHPQRTKTSTGRPASQGTHSCPILRTRTVCSETLVLGRAPTARRRAPA